MKRVLITAMVLAGFVLMGVEGLCRERVKRPVVRFLDFYTASEKAERPPPLLERIAYGLALALSEPPPNPPGRSGKGS